jgi:hypothetical protein
MTVQNKQNYLNILSKVLKENTDEEIINFAEDLIESVKLRHSVLNELVKVEKSRKARKNR